MIAPPSEVSPDQVSTAVSLARNTPSENYNRELSILKKVLLVKATEPPAESRQEGGLTVGTGEWPQPFDFQAAKDLLKVNSHHSTCVRVKRDASVGLGFADEEAKAAREQAITDPKQGETFSISQVNPVETKVDRVLDPLCDDSFQDDLAKVIEDFWNVGNGYLEVVRAGPGENDRIVGIFHIPAEQVWMYRHGAHRYHYVIRDGIEELHWPRFGRISQFQRELTGGRLVPSLAAAADTDLSEVIHFRRSSSMDRYYGLPEWLACVPDIELNSALRQYNLDFFHNRGVPEFIFLLKGVLPKAQWEAVVAQLTGNVGSGNSHKSVALNFPPNPDIDLKVQQLVTDNFNGVEQFKEMRDAIDMAIVSCHRVPPVLAGILIPGKLGATNEIPNALASFQAMLIGPAQRDIQRTLGQTLGNPRYNGGLGLTADDFELRRLTDIIDPGTLDVVSRMRETVPEANAEGRDLSEGLRD